MYSPELVMVPADVLPPGALLTSQVTAESVVPVTEAVNCCVRPTGMIDEVGEIETEIAVAGGTPEADGPPPHAMALMEGKLKPATPDRC